METLSVILIMLAGIFGIYWTFKIKKVIPMVITIGMVIAISIILIPDLKLFNEGLYMYLGFVGLGFFYGLADKNRELLSRLVICLMTAGIFLFWLWTLMHWHGNVILAAIFVLLVGIAGLATRAKVKPELGFLVIIAVDAISILLSAY